MPAHRIDRINEEIKRELSLLMRELKDPRIPEMISIIDVNTTPDFHFCKVLISCLDEEKTKEAVKGLKSAAGFIRHEMGMRVKLRITPQFIFAGDDSIAHGVKISKMISDITKDREEKNE